MFDKHSPALIQDHLLGYSRCSLCIAEERIKASDEAKPRSSVRTGGDPLISFNDLSLASTRLFLALLLAATTYMHGSLAWTPDRRRTRP